MSSLSGTDREALVSSGASANTCGETNPHGWVWTWPIEGGEGSVGVCCLCGAVTTGERDEGIVRRAKAEAWDEGFARARGYDWSDHLDRDEVQEEYGSELALSPYRADAEETP